MDSGKESGGANPAIFDAFLSHKRWKSKLADCTDSIVSNPSAIAGLRSILEGDWTHGPNSERIAALVLSLSRQAPELIASLLSGPKDSKATSAMDPDLDLALANCGSVVPDTDDFSDEMPDPPDLSLALWRMADRGCSWSESLQAGIVSFKSLEGPSLWQSPWTGARPDSQLQPGDPALQERASASALPGDTRESVFFQTLSRIGGLFPRNPSDLDRETLMRRAPEILEALSTPVAGSGPEVHARFVFSGFHLLRFLTGMAANAVIEGDGARCVTFRSEINAILSRVFETGRIRLTALLQPITSSETGGKAAPDAADAMHQTEGVSGPAEFLKDLGVSIKVLEMAHIDFVKGWQSETKSLPGPGSAFFFGAFDSTGSLMPPWFRPLAVILDLPSSIGTPMPDHENRRKLGDGITDYCTLAYFVSKEAKSSSCRRAMVLSEAAPVLPDGLDTTPARPPLSRAKAKLAFPWALEALRTTKDDGFRRLMEELAITLFCLSDPQVPEDLEELFREQASDLAAVARAVSIGCDIAGSRNFPGSYSEIIGFLTQITRFAADRGLDVAKSLEAVEKTAREMGPDRALEVLQPELSKPAGGFYAPLALRAVRRFLTVSRSQGKLLPNDPDMAASAANLQVAWPHSFEKIISDLGLTLADHWDVASLFVLGRSSSTARAILRSTILGIIAFGATSSAVLAMIQLICSGGAPVSGPSGTGALAFLVISLLGRVAATGGESPEGNPADFRGWYNCVIFLGTWVAGGFGALLLLQAAGGVAAFTDGPILSVTILGTNLLLQPLQILWLAASSTLLWPIASIVRASCRTGK